MDDFDYSALLPALRDLLVDPRANPVAAFLLLGVIAVAVLIAVVFVLYRDSGHRGGRG